MVEKPIWEIAIVSLVFFVAITLSFGGTYEGKSSYYLITSRASTSSEPFEEYNALSEVACISLCNNKDGCLQGVYNRDSGSCSLEMASCKKQRAKKQEGAFLSTGENVFQFSKVFEVNKYVARCFLENNLILK